MVDFKVIEGSGPGKEERERHEAREWAQQKLSWAVREVAANLLRIIRGAGKPDDLLVQMSRAIDAAVKFQELHNGVPQNIIANDLQIRSEDEDFYAGLQSGRISQSNFDRWREDGTFEQMLAEHTILRGALQTIASELLGQRTQKSAGRREFRQGINDLIDNHEKRVKKSREAARAAARVQKAGKKSGRGREPIEL